MNIRSGRDNIHAFVDGQLSRADRRRFLERMSRDNQLQREVCELRRLKEYVVEAFSLEPLNQQPARGRALWAPARRAVGMVALLACGFLLGRASAITALPPLPELAGVATFTLTEEKATTKRVMLHIGEGDSARFEATLAKAEQLLARYGEERVKVEVVANAGGLDFLHRGRSPFARRINELISRYPELRFIACGNSLAKRRVGTLPLVANTEVAPSALEHVIKRLRQGWVYVRV